MPDSSNTKDNTKNKEVTDIPNVTVASNEDERKHSDHDTPLPNNSNKLSIKPKHIPVAPQNLKKT